MNCPQCGASLEADSNFCVSCGTNLGTNNKNESVSNTKTPANSINKIGLVVGTILIIIGFIIIFTAGTGISSASFGGDFYTYMYKGIVEISEILASIEAALGWIVVAVGAAIDVSSLKR